MEIEQFEELVAQVVNDLPDFFQERLDNVDVVVEEFPDRHTMRLRRPIEMQCRTDEELRAMIRRVVLHEIAHHFGISDNRLRDIGAY
ncbi:MAG: metallopeptidase family protein [Anaerolineae bacterium]|nr:metallopeptidase family protein [Anaerolineae bacterium]